MSTAKLSALQQRILLALASAEPRWVLTGGGALAGFHLGHRETRDLDLFWRDTDRLRAIPAVVERHLRAEGLTVDALQREMAFLRLRVAEGEEVTVVDLVAEPVPSIEQPIEAELGGTKILLDSPHEILVNKLGALLSRAELRDLVDVCALLAVGGDLARSVRGGHRGTGASIRCTRH